ncbi:DUF3592 domain-containing protein [Actinacidiphila paucisporea]|uniref:DUF3592 domain-containing protein n=1 Tax=Actinacidiphila paucisporea TaxID=310782 RepID=A0A1M6VBT3_9ACTN|nr:DUF3592 domain-containing protein [Actinacidiphila paucisporea]SHK78918.1 hypothetical protein SAMN05216499_101639 [Actinacidiphila paucisporea]
MAAAAARDAELLFAWLITYGLFLIGGLLTRIVYRITEDWWRLRRRGITVVATFMEKSYGTTSDGETTVSKVYAYTDASGGVRTFHGDGRLIATDPARIEVTYDPRDPDRAATRHGPAVRAFQLLAFLLIGLPIVVLTAAYPGVYFAEDQDLGPSSVRGRAAFRDGRATGHVAVVSAVSVVVPGVLRQDEARSAQENQRELAQTSAEEDHESPEGHGERDRILPARTPVLGQPRTPSSNSVTRLMHTELSSEPWVSPRRPVGPASRARAVGDGCAVGSPQ